ncbi:hypothetical protein Fuma_05423 [Fuerstiella marisgermanici]|uniref:Uncharacterized protein n=2 Tax=Fuerstiella marisgermanici TaxID=1891926 RepID=A0A1P8WNY2_9PLAN|nr:hypothetical protein Fuma_05423 [Fuerstiella marisgermanici]
MSSPISNSGFDGVSNRGYHFIVQMETTRGSVLLVLAVQGKKMRSLVACLVALSLVTGGLSGSSEAALKSTTVPRFDAAVARGIAFLTTNRDKIAERETALVAYALMKAGVPETDPIVVEGIKAARERADTGAYARIGYDHVYEAGVDAMLLADVGDPGLHFVQLQAIADYVQSVQRADGSWSDSPQAPGDVSMSQYGVLALWAAKRIGCNVSGAAFDNAATYFAKNRNGDGGWGYRPGTTKGVGGGNSTHNMTLAAAGSIAVARTLLYGPKGQKQEKPKEDNVKYGVLEKASPDAEIGGKNGTAYPGYKAKNNAGNLDDAVSRGIAWNQARYSPVSPMQHHKIYFYYTLERASALADLPEGWYTDYGDGLLTLQDKEGAFPTTSSSMVGTSLAILYFMRSTKQILDKQYSGGVMSGARGLDSLFGKKEKKKELTSLDVLIGQLESADLSKLDDLSEEEVAASIQFSDPEELIGRVDALKTLLKNKSAENRRAAYFALGRTGDFSLVPEIMKGLRDPAIAVNQTALDALRYISRKPNGLGLTRTPLAGAETASEERRVEVANQWRTKAYDTWMAWYRKVRPFEETDGLDEIGALTGGR